MSAPVIASPAIGAASQISDRAEVFAELTYDLQSRRENLKFGNGVTTSYDYSARGELTDFNQTYGGNLSAQFDFTYNGVGQLRTNILNDNLPQINGKSPLASPDVGFGKQPGTIGYVANELNQYISVGGLVPTYDDNGNMTGDGDARHLAYNAENRLYAVKDNGVETVRYHYYADGNRRQKLIADTGFVDTHHFYHGDQEIMEAERSSDFTSGDTLRRYIRLPNAVDEVLLMIDYSVASCSAGCAVYAQTDRLGSTIVTTDNDGDIVETYAYTPYGEAANDNAGFPFRFTGQKLDPETGLYYYKARYYDPALGRFLQVDPIGYEDQQNLYAYVGNDPVNMWDPTGLCGTRDENYQDCTINVEDRDSLSADQLKSVETYETKIRETGAAIAEGGTDEEVAAWESIGEFNINSNRNNSDAPNAAATADVEGGSVDIWKNGVDNVTQNRNNPGGTINGDTTVGHIVIHEVYHFTATDIARRAAINPRAISAPLQYRNSEIRNDRAAVAAGKRLGTLPSNYTGQMYRIGNF